MDKDRKIIYNVITDLSGALRVSLDKNKIDSNDFPLHQLCLILASFTAVTLGRALESLDIDNQEKQTLVADYCAALNKGLEKFTK